jgi:hypothetical protein
MAKVWLLILLTSLLAPLWAAPVLDDQVKAAVIYKVMLFTHWQNPRAPGAELVLCVIGRDEVAAALPDLRGRSVGERRLVVRSVNSPGALADCDAAYFAGAERERLSGAAEPARGAGLMTVVDCGLGLCASGAVLSLAVEDGRPVFALDRGRAERQGLAFSAQVLRLARPVPSP